jgi:flagellar protein FliJ
MSPKRFRFHLESVLELRKNKQEQEEKSYMKLVSELFEMDRQIEGVQNERRRISGECERKMTGNLLLDEWRRDLNYIGYLQEVTERLRKRRREIDQQRLRQREVMIDAIKKRKTMDSLKEKYLQEYLFEINRQDQIEIDDWATTGYLRRQ